MRHFLSTLLCLAFALGTVQGVAQTERDKILKLRADYMDSQNAGDAGGCVSYWDEDGAILPPGEPLVRGHDALLSWYQDVFEQAKITNDLRYSDIQILGGWGFATGTYSGTTTLLESGEVIEDSGKFLEVHRRQHDGSWKFYRHMWSSSSPD